METYNEQYYHNSCGPVPYEEPEHWTEFFGIVADHIIADFAPKTVLDAGCAMGYLVTALRDRGVEAYGIDISRYAISKVREDIKPFCVVGSLTDELPSKLPKRFDLVTNIEVLEHLYAEDAVKAVHTLCGATDMVLFSSTPDDYTEATHVNVQQREYWARLFAQCGFFDDISYRPTYITSHAVCYRRQPDILRQVEDYERSNRLRDAETVKQTESWNAVINDKEQYILNQSAIIADLKRSKGALEQNKAELEQEKAEAEIAIAALTKRSNELETQCDNTASKSEEIAVELKSTQFELKREVSEHERTTLVLKHTQSELDELVEKMDSLQALHSATSQQKADLERRLAAVQASYDAISNAFFWKITKPARVLLDAIKKPLRKVPLFRLIGKALRCWRANGWKYTWQKVKNKLRERKMSAQLANSPLFTREELEEQRRHQFPRDILFSIVVPLYNTPELFLREMIQSVIDQTYGNWELCMADGSDEAHRNVEKICRQYMRKDQRIKYKKLEKNLGISGNTNACLEMSEGDYIGLFDHDDLLHPAALHEVMWAICERDADFIYTDENTFHKNPADAFCPHFKPDFAPDTLRSYNYICHFTVFSRELLEEVGVFRPAFDGSQDYDMILRLTEVAKHVTHIPEILYYWRAHKASVAESITAKPYVVEAAHRALQEHLERIGLSGVVADGLIPTTYRIQYQIKETPLVSIVIPNKDYASTLRRCIDSIIALTTYPAYEIIVVENNSIEPETFAYYEELGRHSMIRVLNWEGKFNYSAINNFAVKTARGDYILLLNNDTEVITPDWLQEMLMFVQRKDVGAAGAMLYYPDDSIQHAGVILGIGGVAGHAHKGMARGSYGYMSRAAIIQNYSAVTAACMLIRRNVWEEVGGLDESFEVAFNDVDFCMRIREAGYLIVWTPYAELYHYESKSRGREDTPEKQKRFEGEVRRFQERWRAELEAGDPYYSPNLTLKEEDFTAR